MQALPNYFNARNDNVSGIEPLSASKVLLQVQQRLLEVLLSPLDASILGKGIVDELIYRILLLPQGQSFFALMQSTTYLGNIARTITLAEGDLKIAYTVEELAAHAGMSISAFHRAFKQVTQMSPLQYIK